MTSAMPIDACPPVDIGRLDQVVPDALTRLRAAVADRRHAMRTPVLVTADAEARLMTLRGCDEDLATLRFHSDVRCPKVATIRADSRVSVLAYDPAARVQLRLKGTAHVLGQGAQADAAWAATALMGRRCYMAEAGPGTPLPEPGAALPDAVRQRRPTLAESEAGRMAFAIVLVRVDSLDWLHLNASGGQRALLHRRAPGEPWQGSWIAP